MTHTTTLEMHDMGSAPQRQANIFSQGTDIGSFRACDTQGYLRGALLQKF
jgi:predicted metalloprotease